MSFDNNGCWQSEGWNAEIELDTIIMKQVLGKIQNVLHRSKCTKLESTQSDFVLVLRALIDCRGHNVYAVQETIPFELQYPKDPAVS